MKTSVQVRGRGTSPVRKPIISFACWNWDSRCGMSQALRFTTPTYNRFSEYKKQLTVTPYAPVMWDVSMDIHGGTCSSFLCVRWEARSLTSAKETWHERAPISCAPQDNCAVMFLGPEISWN